MGGERSFSTRGHGVLPSLAAAMALARRVCGGQTARQVAEPHVHAGRRHHAAARELSGFFTLPHGLVIETAITR